MTMKSFILIAAIFLGTSACPAMAGQFEDGVTAYEAGKYAIALKLLQPLAEQGNPFAQNNLGIMYNNGHGVPQDFELAKQWYMLAANQNDAGAQYNLGLMYKNGEGMPQDYAEAVKWFSIAANQGYSVAQNGLGLMYNEGEGLPQNYPEAVKWFVRAAAQGDADAISNIQAIHEEAFKAMLGSEYKRCMKLMLPLAELGDGSAQNNIGMLYEDGLGVPQDFVQAHMWANLATVSFKPHQMKERGDAIKRRDRLANRMTSSQIAQAQRLAQVWTAKHSNN